jgi:hypothetical protein
MKENTPLFWQKAFCGCVKIPSTRLPAPLASAGFSMGFLNALPGQ